jgi:hypothetical protein
MNNSRALLFLLVLSLSTGFCAAQNLPYISSEDRTFSLGIDKYDETPLIFGYKLPDVNSEKMICFSSATDDVEDNPHKCTLGAHYESFDLNIEYVGLEGYFVKLLFKEDGKIDVPFYIQKENVVVE